MYTRQQIKQQFQNYVSNYNPQDIKIRLKAEHTYRVADLSEQIAASLQLDQQSAELAWLIGMLHDIGRFEQVKRFHTFIDDQSIDHALLGVNILFDEGLIRRFIQETTFDEIIRQAIQYHNAFELPQSMDERTLLFANLIRDADKIDILRVNVEIPIEEIYNIPREEFENSEITPAVLRSFKKGETVLRSLKKTPMDHVVGQISLVNGLVYQESRRLVKEQGYLDKMLQFPTVNQKTKKQLGEIREIIEQQM